MQDNPQLRSFPFRNIYPNNPVLVGVIISLYSHHNDFMIEKKSMLIHVSYLNLMLQTVMGYHILELLQLLPNVLYCKFCG